ncbi:hypothetical protein [Streptacidiphilus anmyonensis]|uniref:hypothetical protein n=1 Tax=Streptacidiphilus anmyonensis TaxID=405782 RepID=UPI000B26F4FE
MLLLGLLLIAATAAFTGLVIADNLSGGPVHHVTVLGHTIATMNSLEIFLSGLALALIFCLGLAMTGTGGMLARRRRLRLREAGRVGRHVRTGDAVPTTPNGTAATVGRPVAPPAAPPVAQPAAPPAQPRTSEPGTATAGSPGDTAPGSTTATVPEPTTAPEATKVPEATTAPEATTTSARPRRHIHLFGH